MRHRTCRFRWPVSLWARQLVAPLIPALVVALASLADPLTAGVRLGDAVPGVIKGSDLERIRRIVQEHEIRRIVVGLPLDMDGREGARVKITEAMAARVPLVATRLAAEGLGLSPGDHYAASDTAEGLGEQVVAHLLAPASRAEMAKRGRALAEERWSLESAARIQNGLCATIASG